MVRKIFLPVILLVLAFGFWISPNFKEIAAGVAIFLFGMIFLEEGFRTFTGGLLERLLKKTTDNLWKSLSFGILTTTVMQSSSLVSVITISFLSAGLIGLAAGIGIIFGANIGTTTGAWLVAGFGLKVNIAAYAMPMLAFGAILVFQSSKNLKGIGYVLAGLGLLFLGIHHMKTGFDAFRDTIDLTKFAMTGIAGLLVYTLIGTVATVIMQSSHATLVLIITALAVGQISYENALALAIGANIGTTITAIIGALSANYQGKRLAAAHLIFNLVTALIAIVFMKQMIFGVETISHAVGIAEDDYTLKLAVFHTLFNLIGVVVMSPAIGFLVKFLERAIEEPTAAVVEPKYLNESVIDFPETLLEAVRNEVLHLYDNALEIIAHGLSLHRHVINSDVDLSTYLDKSREVMELDVDSRYLATVKSLYSAIVEFISRAQQHVPAEFTNQTYEFRTASRNIVQSVKDIKHLRKNASRYIVSNNEAIRHEYNAIRYQIASLLRTIHRLREGDETVDILDLDEFKVAIEQENSIATGNLDRLIREGKITPAMATSLMNDYGYAQDIIWHLVEMVEIMFGAKDTATRDAESLIALDDEEIRELAKQAVYPENAPDKIEPVSAATPSALDGSSKDHDP